ncbi:MAG: YHS domain-containing protein [Myxococcales bacterium]|nr:YHS domain-containing protein [Myxococcales bacterium]
MARSSRFPALVAIMLSACAVLACENDAPKAEPVKPAPVAEQAPAAATPVAAAANPQAGACGSPEEAQKEQGGGCGSMAKAAAPGGCGCAGHDTGSADKPVVPITEAKLGDRTRCPVTNSVFVVKTDSPKTEHAGKTYHFCCEGCVTRFKQDPKQFLES